MLHAAQWGGHTLRPLLSLLKAADTHRNQWKEGDMTADDRLPLPWKHVGKLDCTRVTDSREIREDFSDHVAGE